MQVLAGQARIVVLLNSGSGKRDTSQVPDLIRAAFKECGTDAEVKLLKHGNDIVEATRQALDDGFETIVAAGGDGTISGVASVLRGSGATMGILPLGTFNYFARSLNIPLDIPEAVRLLTQGVRRQVRIASINDRVFLNNASLGAYPAILKTREEIYRRWGRSRAAAYWSVLVALITLRRPLHLRIEAGDKVIERHTPLVFAVNNAFQLDQVGLDGRDEIAAGRLAVFIAPHTNRWGMLRNSLLLALGLAGKNDNFDLVAAERVRIIESHQSHDVACDGERSKMAAPYELRVIEDELTVLVPASHQDNIR